MENTIRKDVVKMAESLVGGSKCGVEHRVVINTYNSYLPHPRGYVVQLTDQYCAAFVSAVWIMAEVGQYLPIECSCSAMVKLAKALGMWNGDTNYNPLPGDAVMYDWDGNGAPNHVGIVVSVDTYEGTFTTIEGNMDGGKIGRRTVKIGNKNIYGFITPEYESMSISSINKTFFVAFKVAGELNEIMAKIRELGGQQICIID